MDSSEFKVWGDRLKVLFPKFREWLASQDVGYRNELSAEWERALSRVEFVDAMEAITEIHIGEAEPFNQWEYGTWIAHIRKIADQKRAARTSEATRKTFQFSREPRYDCWRCLDTAFVTLWHWKAMESILQGKPITYRTMATICNCSRGRALVTPEGSKRKSWTQGHVFDESKHCLYDNNEETLREFVATYQARQVQSMPNYSSSLAAFNKGTD